MYIQAVPYSLLLRMYMFLDNQFMKLTIIMYFLWPRGCIQLPVTVDLYVEA